MAEEMQSMKRTPVSKSGWLGRLVVLAGLLAGFVKWVSANLVTYVPWIALRAIATQFAELVVILAVSAVGYGLIRRPRPLWTSIALALVVIAVVTTLPSLWREIHVYNWHAADNEAPAIEPAGPAQDR